jgi:chemotaxis protein CheY-P-specific phosphatase CheC
MTDGSPSGLVRLVECGTAAATSALGRFLGDASLRQGPIEQGPLAGLEAFGTCDLAHVGVGVEVPFTSRPASMFLMLLDDVSAAGFARRMLGAMTPTAVLVDSVLLEAGNITACAFGDAMARYTHMPWVPNVPNLRRGGLAEVVRSGAPSDAFLLTTQFIVAEHDVHGRFAWLADAQTARSLAARLGDIQVP